MSMSMWARTPERQARSLKQLGNALFSQVASCSSVLYHMSACCRVTPCGAVLCCVCLQHLDLELSEGFELLLEAGDELSELKNLRSLTISGKPVDVAGWGNRDSCSFLDCNSTMSSAGQACMFGDRRRQELFAWAGHAAGQCCVPFLHDHQCLLAMACLAS